MQPHHAPDHRPHAPPLFTQMPPPGIAGRGLLRDLLAAGLAAAGPDQAVAVTAFIIEQIGVDRRAEAGVIQLDRDIIPPLVGALRPPGSDLSLMRCTA